MSTASNADEWAGRAALGQSGALVTVEQRDGHLVVRKASHDRRCGVQASKQAAAREFATAIRVPRVIDAWDGESFTMDYVPGVPLGEFLQVSSLDECARVAATLTAFIRGNWRDLQDSPPRTRLNAKLAAMQPGDGASRTVTLNAIGTLRAALQHIVLPPGWNHGDLSFENVLITPRDAGVWCLDFLDSPIESPLIDVGRLLVDAEHGWWRTAYRVTGAEVVGRQMLSRSIRDLCAQRSVSDGAIAAVKALAALRILPYSRDPARVAILTDVLKTEIPRLRAEVRT